ncbi:MAG: hypothetical protein SNJ52_02450 [Verrucomicrobiia bacterium]
MKIGCIASPRWNSERSQLAFTLLEILLAMAVLLVFTLALTRVFDAMQSTSNFWGQRIDAETQARRVMDRLADDLARMVVRPDVDIAFAPSVGDDRMRFFSCVEGHSLGVSGQPPRGLSVIEYRMDNARRLQRGALALEFDRLIFAPLDREEDSTLAVGLLDGPGNTVPQLDDSLFDVLGDQVLRFEIGFLLDGESPGQPQRLAATLPADTRSSDLAAVIVAIATLDSRARAPLDEAGLEVLASAFPDYTTAHADAGRDILSIWSEVVNSGTLTELAGVPLPSAQAVRVYQRYFPLQ